MILSLFAILPWIAIWPWIKSTIYQHDFVKSKNFFKRISKSKQLQQHVFIIFLNSHYKAQFKAQRKYTAGRTNFFRSMKRMQFINLFNHCLHVTFNQCFNWFTMWSAIWSVLRILLISDLWVSHDSENDENRMICIKSRQSLLLLYN